MLITKAIKLDDDLEWNNLIWESKTATFFQTKEWLLLWMKHWGKSERALILVVFDERELIGIAPFYFTAERINILGASDPKDSSSLSDFGDIIIKSGREREVWEEVLKNIKRDSSIALGMTMELNYIREESPSFEMLKQFGGKIEEMEVSPVISLSKSWDEYLLSLDRHNRHELRRKLRNAASEGVEVAEFGGESREIEELFRLMTAGNGQKLNFLTDKMEEFFREMINIFWSKKIMELKFLKLDGRLIAGTLHFVFKDEILLYNSGFDPEFIHLSPGLILKANLIKKAIEDGKRRFDFLRGGEKYKYDLGGVRRNLYKFSF